MISLLFLVFLLVFLIAVWLARGIVFVPPNQVKIIERLGRFKTSAHAGLYIIFPFVDSIRATLSLNEQSIRTKTLHIATKDGVTMATQMLIFYRIVDPVKSLYEVENYSLSLEEVVLGVLREVLGALDFGNLTSSLNAPHTQIEARLETTAKHWGLRITRVEITNLSAR